MKATTAALSFLFAVSSPLMGVVTYDGINTVSVSTTIPDWVVVLDQASFTLEDGGSVIGTNGSDVSLLADDQAEVFIEGGSVTNDVVALGDAVITVTGGTLNDDLIADFGGTLFVFDGVVTDDVEILGGSTATISGGTFGEDVEVDGVGSILNISGGSFSSISSTGRIAAANGATIVLTGTSFDVNGLAASDGVIGDEFGTLSGVLADGTSISIDYDQNPDALGTLGTIELILVPEPSTTALLGLAGLALIFRRRQ